jgi:hypothetical protein
MFHCLAQQKKTQQVPLPRAPREKISKYYGATAKQRKKGCGTKRPARVKKKTPVRDMQHEQVHENSSMVQKKKMQREGPNSRPHLGHPVKVTAQTMNRMCYYFTR